MTYDLCIALIELYKKTKQTKKLQQLKTKIDVYYANDRLTDAQYNELMAMIG